MVGARYLFQGPWDQPRGCLRSWAFRVSRYGELSEAEQRLHPGTQLLEITLNCLSWMHFQKRQATFYSRDQVKQQRKSVACPSVYRHRASLREWGHRSIDTIQRMLGLRRLPDEPSYGGAWKKTRVGQGDRGPSHYGSRRTWLTALVSSAAEQGAEASSPSSFPTSTP